MVSNLAQKRYEFFVICLDEFFAVWAICAELQYLQ
jgi:hypothetical protein